jgi:E3 ubiquitin-protein ligase RNF14
VYCRACLVSYYEHSIASSKPAQIVCMDEKCAKSRAAAMSPAVSAAVPHAIPTLSPAELFSIGLDESTIRKFVTLREKMAREADKNTVYCPRTWCDGIARPRKPASPGASPASPKPDPESNLAVCTDCSFAFCRHCAQSWHGPYEECRIRTKDQVDANERATERYILENTRACPTCGAPSQKTQGCNHMQCPRCQTHFCYLCSSWLDPRNPYGHYNNESGGGPTECNQRLWEGTDLDALGAPPGQPGRQAPAARGNAVPRAANAVVPQVRDIVAAREGPLVLRLFENAPPPPAAVEPAPPQRDLNQHERDWVMRFVELALQDREDEMPSDDDDDDLIDDRVFAIPRANAL